MAEPSRHSVEALDKIAAAMERAADAVATQATPASSDLLAWCTLVAAVIAAGAIVYSVHKNGANMRVQMQDQFDKADADRKADKDETRKALAATLHGELWYAGKVNRKAVADLTVWIRGTKDKVNIMPAKWEALKPARLRVARAEIQRLGLLGHGPSARVVLAMGQGEDLIARIGALRKDEPQDPTPVHKNTLRKILKVLWDYHGRLLKLNHDLAEIAEQPPHDWDGLAALLEPKVEKALADLSWEEMDELSALLGDVLADETGSPVN